MLVGLAARHGIGQQLSPGLEVGSLRRYLTNRHQVIVGCLDDERDEALAQTYTDCLKVLGLVAAVVRIEGLLLAPPGARQEVGNRYLCGDAPIMLVGHPYGKPDMETECLVAAPEGVLTVEVGRLGDDPTIGCPCNTRPRCRAVRADQLGSRLLQTDNLLVRFTFHVVANCFGLPLGCTHVDSLIRG
jgi:hypothetical protein